MKNWKWLAISLISLLFMGCSYGSYMATMYSDQTVNYDRQHRLLTIGSFKGNKTQTVRIDPSSRIEFRGSVEEGDLSFELTDPNDRIVLSSRIQPGQETFESIVNTWPSGTYRYTVRSRQAKKVRIELQFLR